MGEATITNAGLANQTVSDYTTWKDSSGKSLLDDMPNKTDEFLCISPVSAGQVVALDYATPTASLRGGVRPFVPQSGGGTYTSDPIAAVIGVATTAAAAGELVTVCTWGYVMANHCHTAALSVNSLVSVIAPAAAAAGGAFTTTAAAINNQLGISVGPAFTPIENFYGNTETLSIGTTSGSPTVTGAFTTAHIGRMLSGTGVGAAARINNVTAGTNAVTHTSSAAGTGAAVNSTATATVTGTITSYSVPIYLDRK